MKKLILILALLFVSNSLFSAPPDSCLKVYNNYWDSTFSNPYFVKVDSCTDSPTYGEYYGKDIFRLKFEYNIIPRDYLAPEDTIIEYTWQDILPQYSNAINDFQNIELNFGTFYFRESFPNEPDTTEFVKRGLLLRFIDYVHIDSVEKALANIESVKSAGFNGWFTILTSVNESEINHRTMVYPNPATDYIEFENSIDFNSKVIAIYDVYGRLVKQTTYNNSPLDISELQKGCYIVRVNNTTFHFIKY